LINELNHRVRNIITLVRSIARQTSTHIQSLPQYITNFEKRLMALATAHNLIGGSGMQWANLRHILNIELKAYRSAYTDAITIDGPNVALASDVVPIMTLVIHELATNAVKHGALSKHGKTLKVSWTLDSGGLRLVWEEKVDRITSPPQQINFGLTLIQQALPSECDGECQLDFQPDGMIAKFWLPQQSVQKLSDTQAQQSHEFPDEIQPAHQQADMPSLKPLRALILEDKSILAMEMQSMLELLGFTDILVLSKINPELHDQQFKMIEVAILDIDLGKGHNSFAFAEHLQRLGVPFIFVSGFDETFDYPEIFQTVPRLLKPVSVNDLKRTITQVTRTSQ
jgi:two-component sensor histidine kinase